MTLPTYLMKPLNDSRAQHPHDPSNLVLVYDTNNQPASTVVSVPTFGSAPNGTIDWGDGTTSSFNTSAFQTHTYSSHGVYVVQISGTLQTFNYTVSSSTQQNKPKLVKCLSFGNIGITGLNNAFTNCRNLQYIPSIVPTGIINIDNIFRDTTLNDGKTVTYINPTSITSLNGVFATNTSFNQNIGAWNTSNITNMNYMCSGATAFNQNIESWNTASVTSMIGTFASASSFNQSLSGWNVSSVTSMSHMFSSASSFNQNLSGWDISGLSSSSSLNNFMRSVTLSSANYNSLLIHWNDNKASYRTDLSPNFGSSKYTSAAASARSGLISHGWVITDGGLE